MSKLLDLLVLLSWFEVESFSYVCEFSSGYCRFINLKKGNSNKCFRTLVKKFKEKFIFFSNEEFLS